MPHPLDQTYLQLFLRESHAASLLDFDELPGLSSIDKTTWQAWLSTKREFSLIEVLGQIWLKAYPFGQMSELHFYPDGLLAEIGLFHRRKTHGKWWIFKGLICTEIKREQDMFFSQIVGNTDSSVHSAIEYKNSDLYSYHKLIQVKLNNTCH